MRPDQEDAVVAMLPHDVVVLCAPTAFGKTVTGAAIIALRRVNNLILVHRTELLRQWQERLNAFLGIGKEVVGTIGGGRRKPTGKIDIAVMQSLSRRGEVDPLVEDYGQVIVDDNFARSEFGRTPVRPQGARQGRRASMSPCRRGLVRRHPQTGQSTLHPRTHCNTDPKGRPTANHLHAMWADSTYRGTAGQRTA
ncbi:MAG: DEAD/DEAH box helicase family protein [Sedimenticolaceae bacterium]